MTRVEERQPDLEGLLAALDGNRDLFDSLIRLFLDGAATRLPALQGAVREGNVAQVRREAHTLCGSIAHFSTGPAYVAAVRLEEMARRGDLATAPAECRRLTRSLGQLVRAMQVFSGASAPGHAPGEGHGRDRPGGGNGGGSDGHRTGRRRKAGTPRRG